MKNKSAILEKLGQVADLLIKCGGEGGTPGPCPSGGGKKPPKTVQELAKTTGLALKESSYDKGAYVVPGKRLHEVVKHLEGHGWKQDGGYKSSTGQSIGMIHSTDTKRESRLTLSEPKSAKYREGTFIDLRYYGS